MTKIYLLKNLVIVSVIIVICAISQCNGVISDKRLCYDPECNEPVALARTLVRYNSIEPHMLSFAPNMEIKIFSKEAGRRKDLWGAEVKGKRGYVPRNLLRESKTLKSKLTHEVPTEFVQKEVNTTNTEKVDLPSQLETAKSADKVDVEPSKIADEPQALKDVENIEDKVNELKILKNVKSVEPEINGINSAPIIDSSDSQVKESDQEEVKKILEGVQDVTPPYEVIDGTTIPSLADEVSIKPSHPTPIIAPTAILDEEPILSVHPNLPSISLPLISRLSNIDTQTIVEDHLKSESNSLPENQIAENDSLKQSSLVQESGDGSSINTSNITEEINVKNESKFENSNDKSPGSDTEISKHNASIENTEDNSQMSISSVENDEHDQLKQLENSDKTFVNTHSSEEELLSTDETIDTLTNDTKTDNSEIIKDIDKDLENDSENIIQNTKSVLKTDEVLDAVNESESNQSNSQVDLDNTYEHKPAVESESKTIESKSELDGSIEEQEFQDSKERTEYLSDEELMNKLDNVENSTLIKESEIPVSSHTIEQPDNQVIVNDDTTENKENLTVHNVDEVIIETPVEDDSQNNSTTSIYENDYLMNDLNLSSEEVTTEPYSNLEEENPTISRNLLTVEHSTQEDDNQSTISTLDSNGSDNSETQPSQTYQNEVHNEAVSAETAEPDTVNQFIKDISFTEEPKIQVTLPEVCDIDSDCVDLPNERTSSNKGKNTIDAEEDKEFSSSPFELHNYLETLLYLSVTAFTTLLFSLGYYYIENQRRDKELVAKINVLEKELLVTTKENMMLNENVKTVKHKLDSIENESFGSNEMVVSLKLELEAAQVTKGELEDQIITLEKELESATEAGLELERMLREFLSSQSDENPLAQSVEDLQTRLNAQQATNESLTNNLNLKSQENEALTTELAVTQEKCQQLEVEVTRLTEDLITQSNLKNSLENDFSEKIVQLNKQVNKLSEERADLINQLTTKEIALNDLAEVIKQQNNDNLDFEKFYDVSHIKAEAQLVSQERDELQIRLTEVEGAHLLLEEHMKLIKEEIASVTKQYELAERDKTEAQTRLEVLSNYFKEKESQLQKELGMQEAMWVQKQGEVTSTVDRIQTMQNEIQNYRQQIETLKREILDQEREYKSQIAALETKSHEQWVIARQCERRLEESKAEASQLRNRLTMVEKSMNEVDPDSKLHRLETNGETASSPQLFMGAETSSSPIIFTGSSGVPPLPPSYMYGAPLPPPFIPPPPHSAGGPMYDISRRPPPLGGRLSSPPPIPLHHPPGRYEDVNSPLPPLSPPLHPPYSHRSPPPFSNDHIHSHPPPPPFLPPLGTSHSWGDEPLPPLRNPVFHPHQREQRVRNHKGSLHSSGDSLDKSNHTGKT